MKTCPVCGYNNPDDAVFCERCGSMINQTFSSSPAINNQGPITFQSFDSVTQDALSSLKNALFWIFLGMILAIIPFVDFAGIIILLIGAIKLIIALKKVSKTSLPSANRMKRARDWLIVNFVMEIILVVTTILSMAMILIPAYVSITSSASTAMNNSTISNISKSALSGTLFSSFFLVILILEIIAIVSGFAFYFSLGEGLKSLGNDIKKEKVIKGGKRIITGTVLLLIGVLASVVLMGGLIISIVNSHNVSLAVADTILITLTIPGFIAIAAYIISLIGIYDAYSGL